MIPRVIHQFWDKSDPPQSVAEQIQTWRVLNPDYRHVLWNDRTATALLASRFGAQAAALFKACTVPAARADILRCAVLSVEGGVYVDAGETCMQPLETLLDGFEADALLYRVMAGRDIPGALRHGLRNDFMAGPARSRFFARALAAIFNNIRTKSSGNVWDLTGAGVIRTTYDALPDHLRSCVRVIEREHMFRYTRPNHNLEYGQQDGHSSAQKGLAIVSACDVETMFKCVDTVFVGHPRCGSASLSAALSQAGLDIPHERPGADGMVSWWHTGTARVRDTNVLYGTKTDEGSETWLVPRVVHYLRDPADAIPSIVLENEHNGRANNSLRYRSRTIKKLYDIDLDALDETAAAGTSYALWNRRAEEISNAGRVQVEAPDLAALYPGLRFGPMPRRNTSAAKYRQRQKPALELKDVLQRIPGEARPWLEKYIDIYATQKAQEGDRMAQISHRGAAAQPKAKPEANAKSRPAAAKTPAHAAARPPQPGPAPAQDAFPLLSIEACDLAIRQRTRLMRIVSRDYYALMQKEFETIQPHLPDRVRHVLDIGGGLGGVHVFTNRALFERATFHFLDRDRVDPVMRYGYRPTTEAYNSFSISSDYLLSGGLQPEQLEYYNADVDADVERLAAQGQRFDLILSLKSWCFHYPVDVYADLVKRLLSANGVLIVDVRRNTHPEEKLMPELAVSAALGEDRVSQRVCLKRVSAPVRAQSAARAPKM